MKICSNCGTQNFDTAEKCEKCGCPLRVRQYETVVAIPTQNKSEQVFMVKQKGPTQLQNAAKVFMILSCILNVIGTLVLFVLGISSFALSGLLAATYLIAFVFLLIITVVYIIITHNYSTKIASGIKVEIAFKIITLMFFNSIAGILMLCDSD